MNRTTFDEVIIKNEIRYDLCARDRCSNAWQACKSGVLATLDQKPDFFPALGINTFGIRFEYNAATIHECGNVH
jgi:hypothetical protein